jgi:hypothetical protein
MRKRQKEVSRWLSCRQKDEGYNMQQNLESGMTEPEDTVRQKKMNIVRWDEKQWEKETPVTDKVRHIYDKVYKRGKT